MYVDKLENVLSSLAACERSAKQVSNICACARCNASCEGDTVMILLVMMITILQLDFYLITVKVTMFTAKKLKFYASHYVTHCTFSFTPLFGKNHFSNERLCT